MKCLRLAFFNDAGNAPAAGSAKYRSKFWIVVGPAISETKSTRRKGVHKSKNLFFNFLCTPMGVHYVIIGFDTEVQPLVTHNAA